MGDDRALRDGSLARAIEAILFISDEPIASSVLAQSLEVGRREVDAALEALARDYERRDGGIVLRFVAGGWRLLSHPAAAPYLEQFVLSSRHSRLTAASLETLAIVAYKQPVSRHQVSSIRGVDSSAVLRSLVDRRLIAEVGRDDRPGRAVLYGTSSEFLERLGLPSLSALPALAPLLDSIETPGETPAAPEEPHPTRGPDHSGSDDGDLHSTNHSLSLE